MNGIAAEQLCIGEFLPLNPPFFWLKKTGAALLAI